jgi:hypothetical protein
MLDTFWQRAKLNAQRIDNRDLPAYTTTEIVEQSLEDTLSVQG